MWFGAFIGFVMFIAAFAMAAAVRAVDRKDAPGMVICLLTSLALFVLAGVALA